MRVSVEPVGWNSHELQQVPRPGQPRRPRATRFVRLEDVDELRRNLVHRVERVHRALEHDRRLGPAEVPQLLGRQAQHVVWFAIVGVVDDLPAADHAGWREQPSHAIGQSGLSAAAFSGQPEDFASAVETDATMSAEQRQRWLDLTRPNRH